MAEILSQKEIDKLLSKVTDKPELKLLKELKKFIKKNKVTLFIGLDEETIIYATDIKNWLKTKKKEYK